MKRQKRIDHLELQLAAQGANPKEMPIEEIKELCRAPLYDITENKYRARIKNRATGIRAYCISSCMGGDVAAVRSCTSVTCPLFSFRMGEDPFRGWDIPKVEMEPEELEDGEIDMFEEGDDDAD